MTVERSRIRASMYRIAVQELEQILEQATESIRHLLYSSSIRSSDDYIYSWQEVCELQSPDHDYMLLIQILDNAIVRYPNDPWLRCLRGRALWGNDYYQAALEDLHVALHYAPDKTFPLILLGETYFLQNRYDAACAMLDKAIAYAPRSGRAYLARGLVYHALAQEADDEQAFRTWLILALEDLEQAFLLQPTQRANFASFTQRIKQQLAQ